MRQRPSGGRRTSNGYFPENLREEVADVRLMVAKGKVKATNRGKRARPGETRHSDSKKAYVTVTKGELDVFKDLAKDREEK